MERGVATITKEVGETPLAALRRFRAREGIAPQVPLAYAGRLDPMASGTLLILIGDTCKNVHRYHGLDKAYEFSILFGVRSDTGDVLGIVAPCDVPPLSLGCVQRACRAVLPTTTLPYPAFSSKPVGGKPLHYWARTGQIGSIRIPSRTVRLYALSVHTLYTLSVEAACASALEKIALLPPQAPSSEPGADFRRPEVCASWRQLAEENEGATLQVATCTAVVSAGTYIRTLAPLIATQLGTCGLAFGIHRTDIGVYRPLLRQKGWWARRY